MSKKLSNTFYLYIQKKLYENSISGVISKKSARTFLRFYNIPKQLGFLILKDMENLGLAKPLDKFTLKINENIVDVLDNRHFLVEMEG
jgi:hypothetical protein